MVAEQVSPRRYTGADRAGLDGRHVIGCEPQRVPSGRLAGGPLPSVSLVLPTYCRESVLLATLEALDRLTPPPLEVLVVDQTERHEPEVEDSLARRAAAGTIVWRRRRRPSIPGAMNEGLLAARGDVVLFVDDDVVPGAELVGAHREVHARQEIEVVAGQVLQPGEEEEPLSGESFGFRSSLPQAVSEVMGGNFSVRRDFALAIGGFDESFVGAAYRFEREFCARVRAAGGRILFEPGASLRHLRSGEGGTRAHGDHLRTFRAAHSVGEYYFLLRSRGRKDWAFELLKRPLRAIATRHHLRSPWWVPATLWAELSGFFWATWLVLRRPRLLRSTGRRVQEP